MKNTLCSLKGSFRLLAAVAACFAIVPAARAGDQIEVGDMPRYCQGEAAAAFKVSPRDIQTLPAEKGGDGYKVYGQTPAEGENALFFECKFDNHRKFKRVEKTKDKRAQGGGGGSGSSAGGTPADLQDLVNGRRVGAEVDDEITRRGYKHVKDEESGSDVYSYWKSKKGQCVTVRLNASRHVASIVSGPPADCQ